MHDRDGETTMKLMRFPEFYCPFESKVNKHVDEAQKHTMDWAVRFRLIDDELILQRFQREKSAWLAGRTFVDTGLEELNLASDWCTWLFIFDDQCDNEDFGTQPDKLRKVIDGFISILYQDKKVTLENGTPLEASLSDFWERLKALAPAGFKERYRNEVKGYLEALHWESTNRFNKINPSIAAYKAMRVKSGAVYTVIDLAEITEHLTLSEEVLENPIFQRLHYLANVTSCWSNDVFSHDKEHHHGDVHNLVIALRNEQNVSFEEAVTKSVEQHDQDVKEFIHLENELPSFGTNMDEQVKKYIEVFRNWMKGHIDWSLYDTGRFDEDRLKTK